jgi:4-carboxymuconolactone decarboxylase
MKDLHKMFSEFKNDFPEVNLSYEMLGKEIHEKSGPLSDKVRWLIKIATSGASHHLTALETHIAKARESAVTEEEIKHTLLILITTTGFPTFMEAYSVYKNMASKI